ncbi:MAG: PD40 domain-containing protein [Gammaproteobacteria bacterium]|nr:PD40 domain-containing protein [Gammaproteobacteria bacterium]
MSFIEELKRRNVVRVGIAYAIAAWLIAQVAELALDSFAAPDWVIKTVLLLLIIGFPLALVLAWAYELTPEGIKLDREVARSESGVQVNAHRLNFIILGSVALAVIFLIVDQYVLDNPRSPGPVVAENTSSQRIASPTGAVKRSVVTLDDGNQLALADTAPVGVGRRSLALSPDGTNLVYVVDRNGTSQLYLRRMDEFEASPLDGTEGAFGPFFSPDGQWIGFLTETRIMKVSIRGGTPQALTEAGNVYGAAWGPDGVIVFAEREGLQLSAVSADGGEKQFLAGGRLANPAFLPGGKGILLSGFDGFSAHVMLFDRETGDLERLVERGSGPQYVPTGHLVYSGDSGVMAVPFDLATNTTTGPAVPVLDGVRREAIGFSQLAFSADGTLAYIPGVDMGISTPVWVDRNGVEDPIPLPAQRYGTFRLSPDGSKIALIINSPAPDLWLYDFERATPPGRLTVGGDKTAPIWSPDSQQIAFGIVNVATEGSSAGIFELDVNGGDVRPIVPDFGFYATPNARGQDNLLAIEAFRGGDTGADIWIKRLGEAREPEPFVRTAAIEWGATFSPDGRFIAYTSDESGQFQVYVKPYPPTEARWTISAAYGEEPVWSAAGDEIFYRRGNEWLSVPVRTDPEFEAGVPQVIFEGPYINVPEISYDVAPDGQRFFLLKQQDQGPATRIHIVANWFAELESLAPPTK